MPDDSLEVQLGALDGRLVVGIDEVGRGPLAGPVTAAAVILDLPRLPPWLREGIDDSKLLAPARRLELARALRDHARIGVASCSAAEVDEFNVLQASLLAMRRAVAALGVTPDFALVDGLQDPGLVCEHRCLVGGDGLSLSIAAASIIAKVTRDTHMEELAADFPGYGWERNRGYGTSEHRRALENLGPCVEHRRSFSPIRQLLLSNA